MLSIVYLLVHLLTCNAFRASKNVFDRSIPKLLCIPNESTEFETLNISFESTLRAETSSESANKYQCYQHSAFEKTPKAVHPAPPTIRPPPVPVLPTTMELIQFGIPTVGVWLLQPLLSLIDSCVIGRSNSLQSVAELAALGPGISWCDTTAYMFQFMGMATTILINKAILSKNQEALHESLSHLLITAMGFGCLLCAVQFHLATAVVSFLSGSSLEIIPLAIRYVHIRAFAAIFAVPTIVMQSAFLAFKDPAIPLKAALFGGLFNLLGDLLLVGHFHQGVGGAAFATFLSQFGSFMYLACVGLRRITKNNKATARDFVSKIKMPRLQESLALFSYCGPLFFVLLINCGLWTYTTFACSLSGTHSIAAHQILLNYFYLFYVFGDVLSQMSQTFLPPLMHAPKHLLRQGIGRITMISTAVGSINTILSIVLSQLTPQLLTSSQHVIHCIKDTGMLFALCVFPNAVMAGYEGVLIASEDKGYHSKFYLVAGACFLIYQTMVRNLGVGIKGVWIGLASFQWFRLVLFDRRIKTNMLSTSREEM